MTDKKKLRDIMLEKRMALTENARKSASAQIAEKLFMYVPENQSVALYYPVKGEVDALLASSKLICRKLALPRVEPDTKILTFREFRFGDPLENGRYQIPCPAETNPIIIPDIILLPLLAFDAKGYRLGYGSGYYDATLTAFEKNHRKPKTIGLAYHFQLVDSLHHEPHDVRMDRVITEQHIWNW